MGAKERAHVVIFIILGIVRPFLLILNAFLDSNYISFQIGLSLSNFT